MQSLDQMQSLDIRYQQASPETRQLIDDILTSDADDQAWVEQLGPALRGQTVAHMLGVSPQAVSSNKGLLRLEMRSGRVGYPVFQFQGKRPVEGLGDVVRVLTPAVETRWTIASWLTSPNAELGGSTPIEALRSGRRSESVMAAARRFAAALSS